MWHAHSVVIGLPERFWMPAGALWEIRNGLIDVQTIGRTPERVCLYLTKQAAMENEVVVSDTMARYASRLSAEPRVALYPCESSETAPRDGQAIGCEVKR
jgi:hypothetical protein